MIDQKYLVEVLNHCLGYGDINSKLIFFGIEENGSIDDKLIESNYNEVLKVNYDKVKQYVQKYEKVKNEQVFYSMITGENGDFKEFYDSYKEQFRIDEMNSNKSKLYQFCKLIEKKYPNESSLYSNFFPFWKKTTNNFNYDPITSQIFGLSSFNEWYKNNFDARKEVLLSYIELLLTSKLDCNIFTFGAHYIFIDFFNKSLGLKFDISMPNKFNCDGRNKKYWRAKYKNLTISILYHPSNYWINEMQIEELLGMLESD